MPMCYGCFDEYDKWCLCCEYSYECYEDSFYFFDDWDWYWW